MNRRDSGRRRFLKDSAALAGVALTGAGLAKGQAPAAAQGEHRLRDIHLYGERSHYEQVFRRGNNNNFDKDPTPGEYYVGGPRTPIQDSVGIITPNPLHYIVSHSNEPPDIDPRQHRLLIHGLVEHPLSLSMDDLKRLPFVSRIYYVECRANGPQARARKNAQATAQITHGLTSCSEWTGVPLALILKEAGLKKEAKWIVAEGGEQMHHSKSVPIEKVMQDVLVAYGQNGEAIRPDQGYPLRLLVPGWQGINNVKWVRRIKVVDQPYMARAESTQYVEQRLDGKSRWFTSELGPQSVISRPSGGHKLAGSGYYQITGLAWSGAGAVKKVDVSTDSGKTWKEAQLQQPVLSKAHTRFNIPWNWDGKETEIQSRCTDETGGVQPTVGEIIAMWKLPSDYFQTFNGTFGNFNPIQPWRVMSDGSVQNAMPKYV